MPPSDDRRARLTPTRQSLPASWSESHRFVPRAFVQPTLGFLRTEAAGGVVMLVAALVALVWANSPWAASYFDLFGTTIELRFGDFAFHHLSELTVQEWVNDGLMVIFFFVVGLEIKRELVIGELRDPRSAALPALAALGGMVVPALLYVLFNAGEPTAQGWGIPMATDIAFAVGVVSLLGRRVPVTAKLFLLALAIVDDLGAILVIALFYTSELSFAWLVAAAAGLGLIVAMRRASVRAVPAYLIVSLFVWLAVLESGVHATVAGVALALLTPVHSFYSAEAYPGRARELVDEVGGRLPERGHLHELSHGALERVQSHLSDLQRLSRETIPPLDRLERALSPWSSFVVVPLFALANAGVALSGDAVAGAASSPVVIGIFLGLAVGKVAGVTAFAWAAIRLGLARLPQRTTWHHMVGIGLLSGIGFTVALFVAALSFQPETAAASQAKIGIFAASLVAGVAGFVWLRAGPARDELDANRDGVLDSRQAHVG